MLRGLPAGEAGAEDSLRSIILGQLRGYLQWRVKPIHWNRLASEIVSDVRKTLNAGGIARPNVLFAALLRLVGDQCRQVAPSGHPLVYPSAAQFCQPEWTAISAAQRRLLARAIAALPRTYREVLRRSWFRRQRPQHIAQDMDISLRRFFVLRSRARRRLAQKVNAIVGAC
ncbi:MAG: hypothetical protein SFV54_08330 [Bryobacteraceae bacterium]|nr:hypothetical protein [Bryobacteraceae bacterium]